MNAFLRFALFHSFCVVSLWLSIGSAQAQTTRFVSTTGTNTNPASATSWATSTTNLQGAINTGLSGDQVWVARGIYKPGGNANTVRTVRFAMKNGVSILGGFVGNESLLSQRPAINPVSGSPSSSTLSGEIGTVGNADNSYHVIYNPASLSLNTTAVLDGFVITGGNADISPDDSGGGVFNDGAGSGQVCSPSFRNCSLQGNSAANGGAMFNRGQLNGQSSPVLTNCVLQSNSATYAGGAMYNYGEAGQSSPVLTNCVFHSNLASTWAGAMYNNGEAGQSSPVLTNCTLQANSATFGGVMVNDGRDGQSTSVLTNCVLWNNSATFVGGAIMLYNFAATVTVSYSLFDNTITDYSSGPGNLITATSPFVSPTSVALAPNSPAIDRGLNSAPGLAGITTDLAGNPRVMGCRVDMGAVEFVDNTDGLPTVIITLPNGSTVSVSGNLPTLTLPPNGPLLMQASGGIAYERTTVLDRINGYEVRQVDQNTTGLFPITKPGLFTLTVTGANGCSRTVQGVVQTP